MFDGDAREDAVRHLVSRARSDGEVPRRREAGVRHDARRLDVHARPARAHLVPPGRRSPPAAPPARASRSTAATTACSSPRRPRTSACSPSSSPTIPTAICGRRPSQPETNKTPDDDRQTTFKNATDIAAVTAIVDLDRLAQGMGGRGADQRRRRLLRRQPQLLHLRHGREGVRLPAQRHRRHASTGWATFDQAPFDDHPIYWWERRAAAAARRPAQPGWR